MWFAPNLGKKTVVPVPLAHNVPMLLFILDNLSFALRNTTKPFKQLGNDKQLRSFKNAMPNVLVSRVRFHKGYELSIFVFLAIWEERKRISNMFLPVSYTHLRAHETRHDLVCRLLLEK